MKIAFILDEIAPGSAPKLLGWPIRELKKIGIEAEAIVIARKHHHLKYKDIYEYHLGDIKIRYISDVFPWIFKNFNFKFPGMSFFSLHHFASYLFAHRVVEKKEFDLVIAHCQYSTFAARSIKRKLDIPFITLIWDPSTFTADKIYKKRMGIFFPLMKFAAVLLDWFALSKCEGVITSGKFHHSRLKKITQKPIYLLYPGCNPLPNLPSSKSRINIIFCFDRWDIGNDPELLLLVLLKMSNKTGKMVIGGFWHPPSMHGDFEKKVSEYGLGDRVSIIGALNDSDIEYWASKAKVHLHVIHEAFGMQSLEVSACGCPSIIINGSGVTELFQDGVSGYHPDLGDLGRMAQCCDRLLNDFDHFSAMSNNAYKSAKQYDWKSHAMRIKEIAELAIPQFHNK
jgi:glycosyltransferase involved in cell wall biosynthesis